MQIQVNGEARAISGEMDLAELLRCLRVQPEIVAVELNEEVVARAKLSGVRLKDGDIVEIVRMVGGG